MPPFPFLSLLFGRIRSRPRLVDINTQLPQIRLGQINLLHKFLVRGGDVVEGEDAPTQTEEQECAEGHEGPEGELFGLMVS